MPDLSICKKNRVIIAMSGGVDSSAAAALLKDAGVDVIGVFLHVWDYHRDTTDMHGSCCSTEDSHDARRVAGLLDIPFYSMDMRKEFRRDVIDPFIADYAEGRTPNPCARCNRFVKFGALLDAADRLDARFIATGHYVQRVDDASGMHILRGADTAKDQSYFLATTHAKQLARILFPVGHLQKDDTRKLAAQYQLPTAEKQESQDICFVSSADRTAFLAREGGRAGFEAGDIVDATGQTLGQHKGIAHYTLGQRRGLDLPNGPWHVVNLDADHNRVVVAPPQQATISGLEVEDVSWIHAPEKRSDVKIQTRYRSPSEPCNIDPLAEGVLKVSFDTPQALTAPGQVAAFYTGHEMIGGGMIRRVFVSHC